MVMSYLRDIPLPTEL